MIEVAAAFGLFLFVAFTVGWMALSVGGDDLPPLPEREFDPEADAVATRLALRREGRWLLGRRGEVHLLLRRNFDTTWRVVVRCGLDLPPGMAAHTVRMREADRLVARWRFVHGPAADLRWWLSDPTTWAAAEVVLATGGQLHLTTDLSVDLNRTALFDGVDAMVAFGRALAARRCEPIQRVLERLGQPRHPAPLTLERLSGAVDGVTVHLRLPHLQGERWVSQVEVWLRTPLPEGSALAPQLPGFWEPEPLGDLVYDASPLRISTSNPDALKERICLDAVRGPLLDALLSHRDARLTEQMLMLPRSQGALDVEALLDQALELVELLG